ncbi:MAG: 3'-5' exonuclease [Desulfobacteraceae bacterium]|nr:MAG: 3'-5' exonuclease [Desulfobacteraceae bacterium]
MPRQKTYQRLLPSGKGVESDISFDWQAHFESLSEKAVHPGLISYLDEPPVPGSTPIGQVRMLALDFETTGLDAKRDAIISIGFIPFTHDRIYCQGARHLLVTPDFPLSEESVAFHGITHTELEGAASFARALDVLLPAMKGHVVVVHYHAIERQFLYHTTLRRMGEVLEFPMIDTMAVEARQIKGRTRLGRMRNRLKGWIRPEPAPSLRLADTRQRYGLPCYQAHHALTDALATAELLQAQLRKGYSPDTPVSSLWM